jgi:GNAT superfamily N-acetyltransferase
VTDQFVYTSPEDPRAKPLIDELTYEYDWRYKEYFDDGVVPEMTSVPHEQFQPPDGAFVLLLRDGQAIGGGAFMRYDERTAEFKRIWTRSDLRRQGIAQRVMAELEAHAERKGYRRVYLTTGFKQPEAVAFYLGLGYTALFDQGPNAKRKFILPFEKELPPRGE